MSMIYKKLAAAKPIRSDVSVTGASFASLGGYNNDTNSESYKYGQYAETKTDYYYGKDDDNLKAVVAKVVISATDEYKAAKKIAYIQGTKTFAVGGTDTVEYDGVTYTWKATGTAAGAGAWEDADGNATQFVLDVDDDILDAKIEIKGTSYTKDWLWVKNICDNVAANGAIPTTQADGTGSLNATISTLTGAKLKDKTQSASIENEADKGWFVITLADANGDHEGKEVRVDWIAFVNDSGVHTAMITFTNATDDYELAQALGALNTGDALDLTTLAIS